MDLVYIKNHLPAIELSYDFINHNKVYNLYIAIPYGKKYLVWFTFFNNENICLLIEINAKTKEFKSFEIITVSYDHLLYGTILYGTIVFYNNVKYFLAENVHYFNHNNVEKKSFDNKIVIFDKIFSRINNNIYSIYQTVIGLCVMSNNHNSLLQKIENLNYNIFCILHKNTRINSTRVSLYNNDKSNITAIFAITPDIHFDIYHLHIYSNNGIVPYQKAFIPDYKTSVMMNDEFRIIRENHNLDLLEESDDEDDFENIDIDKHVFLERIYNFECKYNSRFKKWIPIKKTNIKKITNLSTIKQLTQKK